MKKFILPIILIIMFITICFLIFNKEESNLKKVKVGEVAHSIFYAPQYVAHSKGYFKEEGLDVEIILTSGVNNKLSVLNTRFL